MPRNKDPQQPPGDPSTPTAAPNDAGPVYFWRETDPTTGWLSQWYYCPFRDDEDPNKVYFTAEHYMMHHKALLFNDMATAHQILTNKSPRKAKALGRKVSNFSEPTWLAHREAVVRRGNLLKFTRAVSEAGFQMGSQPSRDLPPLEASLRELLLATGERELVEASPFDPVWGIGYRERDAELVSREDWGLNLLGKALMDVRAMLRRPEGS
ncbi:hypothetical protein ACRALDRAFT_1068247 [Sodiomyces alcalophilus JCM 7366]|uniref:uncharacterized protein n=1 Tax=Sodiomyces alcalophilus JCM 7366 TaxID=591952 RepID=UPI0039B67F83